MSEIVKASKTIDDEQKQTPKKQLSKNPLLFNPNVTLAAKECLNFPLHIRYFKKDKVVPIVVNKMAFSLIFFALLEYDRYAKYLIFSEAYQSSVCPPLEKLILRVLILMAALRSDDLPSDDDIAAAIWLVLDN